MRGTTQECLADLFNRLPAEKYTSLLAEFVGVELKTIRRWEKGQQLPKGEILLRIRALLEALGYELTELKQLPFPSLRVAQLIGYGATDVESVQSQLEYRAPSGLYRLLLHGGHPMKTQAYRLERLASNSEDDLSSAKQKWEDRLVPLREQLEQAPKPEKASALGAKAAASPVHRRRERSQRQQSSESKTVTTANAKALSHALFAVNYLLMGVEDVDALAVKLGEQFSEARLQAMRSLLDRALRSKLGNTST